MWDVRGWKRLTAHDEPALVGARREFQTWLAEVPEPWQSIWKGRLESPLDHPHLSVRLELYLHHYFKGQGWAVNIEPDVPETRNKPDFRVTRGRAAMLVEAKAILDAKTMDQETTTLRQVADNLSGKLSRDVVIEPLSDLSKSLPAKRIKAQIEHRAKTGPDEILEFDLSDMHQGVQYGLRVILLPKSQNTTERGGVGGTISGVHDLTIGRDIRDALEKKAGKYGDIDIPFLIAVYGAGDLPVRAGDEFDALFGDRVWNLHSRGQATETRKPNGFFNKAQEMRHHHEHVSAVLFYQFRWLQDSHIQATRIYHNPFAVRPINPNLFPKVPQLVSCLKWVNRKHDMSCTDMWERVLSRYGERPSC